MERTYFIEYSRHLVTIFEGKLDTTLQRHLLLDEVGYFAQEIPASVVAQYILVATGYLIQDSYPLLKLGEHSMIATIRPIIFVD
jgi:hypothetical protein